ncbi:hypothetical protein SO802_026248 [Lithocarpus litseifolius]|uniref:Reverse transcriptase n=1 Tax=Lithocarpus litseifolius TaxID=425828 RepID=A0AAW2C164_9ROSI
MDKTRPNRGVGMVRTRLDDCVEEYVFVDGDKQVDRVSAIEGRCVDHNPKSMVEDALGIIKHAVTLFRGKWELRKEMLEVWRLTGVRADEIIESLPFDGAAVSDTIGFVGGIWMLWRLDLVQVDVLTTIEQEIHSLIHVRSQTLNWLISAIYASPRFAEWCILRNNLRILANMHDLPWALMGDFNEVLSDEEKYGGNPICQRWARAIKERVDDCHMMDLGF